MFVSPFLVLGITEALKRFGKFDLYGWYILLLELVGIWAFSAYWLLKSYELYRSDADIRPQNMPLYSWDKNHEYRYTDVFPQLSCDGKLLVTEKDADSSIVIMDPDGSNKARVFHAAGKDLAFAPSWSPDGQWIAFGFGNFFGDRHKTRAKIMMVRRDGTGAQDLTGDTPPPAFQVSRPTARRSSIGSGAKTTTGFASSTSRIAR